MTAAQDLTGALLRMVERGQRTRCVVGETSTYWTSDDPELRHLAASWCTGCPIAELCAAYADEIHATWGVWNGTDYSTNSITKKRKIA